MRFYTVETLSGKSARTPEGFLLFTDATIARTGEQLYGPDETPIEAGDDGVVHIDRPAEEVFRAETVASFNGKPVVNEHPKNDERAVTPENFRELVIGAVLDPRRGKNAYSDFLLADILIYDVDAIQDVLTGKRELSCGYDADYIQTGPGRGYQKNIIGNHVALVDSARCGSACRIGDHRHGGNEMAKKTWLDSLKCAISSKDDRVIAKVLDTAPEGVRAAVGDAATDEAGGSHAIEQHFHLAGHPGPGGSTTAPAQDDRKYKDDASIDAKFGEFEKKMEDGFKSIRDDIAKHLGRSGDESEEEKKKREAKEADDRRQHDAVEREIEGSLKEEAPPGTGDDDVKKATDSALLSDSFQQTVAMAEIIAPGIQIPTFDSKRKPKETFLEVCRLRQKALRFALNDAASEALVTRARGGRPLTADALDKMPCSDTRTLFYAVGELKRAANSAGPGRELPKQADHAGDGKITSIRDWNKSNAEFYKPKT